MAWDAAERYAVVLLWRSLPEVHGVAAPAEELMTAAQLIKSRIRQWPYKQLARTTWGRRRLPADDTELWLDAAGAMAAMRHHLDVESRWLEPAFVLRPADWAGAVIGMIRHGVNTPVSADDLVAYARECPEIAGAREPDDGEQAYDPFASGIPDEESLRGAFEAVLMFWEAVRAVSEEGWLTSLGWWGLPRALARAWNGDFDTAGWVNTAEPEGTEASWSGAAPAPEDLGILRPPLGF
jgi:hypothetical protein